MLVYHISPQQHGHFQWPDFEDNSSFFISGVFSSVLILDTFFCIPFVYSWFRDIIYLCVSPIVFILSLITFICLPFSFLWDLCVCVIHYLPWILFSFMNSSLQAFFWSSVSFLASEIFLLFFLVYWVMFAHLTFSFRYFMVSNFEGTTHLFLVFPFPP